MSIAGIQSNRGDGFQTLVAFDWALTILSNPDYQWLEIDSVSTLVDDIVIGKSNEKTICCQCKKNQSEHKAWSISDLSDELDKAIKTLVKDSLVDIYFYSRTPFGDLSALQEFRMNYDETTYYTALEQNKKQKETNAKITELIIKTTNNLSSYQFLTHITFHVTPNLERMKEHLEERLQIIASNPSTAFDTLWTFLDHLGMRAFGHDILSFSSPSRVNKDDLQKKLNQSGSLLSAPINMVEVQNIFKKTSTIGRKWQREIGTERIKRTKLINELLQEINNKTRSILLTGGPGSGKTCVMLELQERLENIASSSADLLPVFIQSREFADLSTQERLALGLPDQWVEKIARVNDNVHIVVIIDSLDVLSIAREHTVLTYFLAKIDQLLLLPNITVVTVCRAFDRQYDRRISCRTWEIEYSCPKFDWNTEIAPLLTRLHIDFSILDETTKLLIQNPRELALFVELAQKKGSFNVITSQELAQYYIDQIITFDPLLDDDAQLALEKIATEMLNLRSLSVPKQRLAVSDEVRTILLSQNILHETEDQKLSFGHQTLLDVLIISSAIRQGISLNTFIQSLPPVPFIRPTIRSFVMYLASRERKVLRQQIRAVLFGDSAFHIRRLVAESFAEQIPQDDDWSLIHDIRRTRSDVFLAIYTHASHIEWHRFWLKNLIPTLEQTQDFDGMKLHAHHISRWLNDDPESIIEFWLKILDFDWCDDRLRSRMAHSIENISIDKIPKISPLLLKLLALPQFEYSRLGRALARSISSEELSDDVLWSYIIQNSKPSDIFDLDFDKKLRCQAYEFGDKHEDFLTLRMSSSVTLLELAVSTLEQWCKAEHQYGEEKYYKYGYIDCTSYSHKRTIGNIYHENNLRLLMSSIEAAIIHNAVTNSKWWQDNQERLCFNQEGALRYIALLVCIKSPLTNLNIISNLLLDERFLHVALSHDLSYELGTLTKCAFIHLPPVTQDKIQTGILNLYQNSVVENSREYHLKNQFQLLSCIPNHLYFPETINLLEQCSQFFWVLERTPHVTSCIGVVNAPFSYEIFNQISDEGVIYLLRHYNGYNRDRLIGGEEQVAQQLSQASSRDPLRYLFLLSNNWEQINDCFCNHIMEGISLYLRYEYGNLTSGNTWVAINKPDIDTLVSQIFDQLEKNISFWHQNRIAAQTLEGCSAVIKTAHYAERLTSLTEPFLTLKEKDPISGSDVSLFSIGRNMALGYICNALIELIINLKKANISYPENLVSIMKQLAGNEHQAIRAVILYQLAYIQYIHPEFGWELFAISMQHKSKNLWNMAEPCLYYSYQQEFNKVSYWLNQIILGGNDEDLEVWGRISALANLSNKIEFNELIEQLNKSNSSEAWKGAATVWGHSNNIQHNKNICFNGFTAGLKTENQHALIVANQLDHIFYKDSPTILLPISILKCCLFIQNPSNRNLYKFPKWLNGTYDYDPSYTLDALEIILNHISNTNEYLEDYNNHLTQLLTRLFAYAEELEESDNGEVLKRVILMQDIMLKLGIDGMSDWLKAAERP